MSTKLERQAYISRRAEELARSGDFSDWLGIEHHLRFQEGYAEARGELDRPHFREQLNRLCKQAKGDDSNA
jgi:hypothetical protein